MHTSAPGKLWNPIDARDAIDFITVNDHGVNRSKRPGGAGIAGTININAIRVDHDNGKI